MGTAQQILLVYGVLILAYALLLGVPLAAVRNREPVAPRHLVNSHLSGLMQAGIVLGLAAAVGATAFDSGLATAGALIVAAGFGAETIGGTLNWLTATGDQFAEGSIGLRFNQVSAPLAIIGVAIIAYGVLTGL